jgi:DNA-directed RNA polymerase specialized sigma54-like protein
MSKYTIRQRNEIRQIIRKLMKVKVKEIRTLHDGEISKRLKEKHGITLTRSAVALYRHELSTYQPCIKCEIDSIINI